MRETNLSDALLAWYDLHARQMPWRTPPAARKSGVKPDPYRVWMSEVMLQQTTVAAVRAYFERFTALWPTVADLAAADDGDVMAEWAGLGYYARARNLLACARSVMRDHGGVFPDNYQTLLTLPGVGPYTAAAIASIAFDEAAVVVDGNVERVMARLYAVQTPLPPAKAELTALAASLTPANRPGDYAQAVMDLGATICTPRSPACGICPWMDPCAARAQGIAAELPRKLPKPEKPTRLGTVWIARTESQILLERRPERGLLGGMTGFVGSDWDGMGADAPFGADWENLGEARHTFTHFHLILQVLVADLPSPLNPERGAWHNFNQFRAKDLPTVMRKPWDIAAPYFQKNRG